MSDPLIIATAARNTLINQLRRSDVTGATNLNDRLKSCSLDEPCRSAACFDCGLGFQRSAVTIVEEFIGEPSRLVRGRKHVLTIVSVSGVIEPDGLTLEVCLRARDNILAGVARCRVPAAIGAFEVSFNEDVTGEVEPHWCAHAHFIGVDWLADEQVARLREAFPASPMVKRPIKSEPLDERLNGKLYPFKPERTRRVSYIESNQPDRAPYRATKHRPLRADQAPMLAVVDDELGFHGRLLTHGVNDDAVRSRLEGLGWPRDGP